MNKKLLLLVSLFFVHCSLPLFSEKNNVTLWSKVRAYVAGWHKETTQHVRKSFLYNYVLNKMNFKRGESNEAILRSNATPAQKIAFYVAWMPFSGLYHVAYAPIYSTIKTFSWVCGLVRKADKKNSGNTGDGKNLTNKDEQKTLEDKKKKIIDFKTFLEMKPPETKTRLKKLKLSADDELIVVGDIHGHWPTLDGFFNEMIKNKWVDKNHTVLDKTKHFIFLGDYTDRGKNDVAVLQRLFTFYVKNPKNVHLIRGNHETCIVNQKYGFLGIEYEEQKAPGYDFKEGSLYKYGFKDFVYPENKKYPTKDFVYPINKKYLSEDYVPMPKEFVDLIQNILVLYEYLPHGIFVEQDGKRILFCHGAPVIDPHRDSIAYARFNEPIGGFLQGNKTTIALQYFFNPCAKYNNNMLWNDALSTSNRALWWLEGGLLKWMSNMGVSHIVKGHGHDYKTSKDKRSIIQLPVANLSDYKKDKASQKNVFLKGLSGKDINLTENSVVFLHIKRDKNNKQQPFDLRYIICDVARDEKPVDAKKLLGVPAFKKLIFDAYQKLNA